MKLARIAAAATAVAVIAGGGAAALAVTSGSSGPDLISGCVALSGTGTAYRHIFDVYTTKTPTCPKNSFPISWNQQGPPGPATLSVTATTSVTNRPDGGNHGYWAADTFTRTATVTRHSAVEVSHCGGGALVCYYYTASISDTGSFTTQQAGQVYSDLSPNAGTPIHGTVEGTMTGGSAVEFYAGSATAATWDGSPSTSGVPATENDNNTVPSGESTTTNWVEQFFPSGTIFNSAGNPGGPSLLNWSWTYEAPNTCEKWVDAYNNGDGGQAADGDITGVNAC